MREIKAGDWVRFQHSATILLGVVQYVRKNERYPYDTLALTDVGTVSVEDVLEVRVPTQTDPETNTHREQEPR